MKTRFEPWDLEVRMHREGMELCVNSQNPSGPEAWLSGQVCQAWLPLFWRWVFLRWCLSLLCKWTSAVPAPPALQTCPEISEPWLWLNPASCQLYLRNKPNWIAYINLMDTCLTQQVKFPYWPKESHGVLAPYSSPSSSRERKPE